MAIVKNVGARTIPHDLRRWPSILIEEGPEPFRERLSTSPTIRAYIELITLVGVYIQTRKVLTNPIKTWARFTTARKTSRSEGHCLPSKLLSRLRPARPQTPSDYISKGQQEEPETQVSQTPSNPSPPKRKLRNPIRKIKSKSKGEFVLVLAGHMDESTKHPNAMPCRK
jgi:hypothetical protein